MALKGASGHAFGIDRNVIFGRISLVTVVPHAAMRGCQEHGKAGWLFSWPNVNSVAAPATVGGKLSSNMSLIVID